MTGLGADRGEMTLLRRLVFPLTIMSLISVATTATAQTRTGFGVEGHVFSAETLRPLQGAVVELWNFPTTDSRFAMGIETDEGGFYRFEFEPTTIDEHGDEITFGYAFSYLCRYGEQEHKVQIVPLYMQLRPGRIYQRNVYLNVPASVRRCN